MTPLYIFGFLTIGISMGWLVILSVRMRSRGPKVFAGTLLVLSGLSMSHPSVETWAGWVAGTVAVLVMALIWTTNRLLSMLHHKDEEVAHVKGELCALKKSNVRCLGHSNTVRVREILASMSQ